MLSVQTTDAEYDVRPNSNISRSPYDSSSDWKRARGILARSFYKELRANGLGGRQIVELSNELLRLVSTDVEKGDHNW
ncbi:MAG TPA: hypothetical protein DIU15_00520 [Deltaproteobacteria bacterium]|nr:hypothetical protein [Deltaproteobacteria bacterium]HCP44512.1 hypothetical protein [Deltaproteobacteria bacterium]|tara:strand:+ start:137 stop:370 length:234 start_codon:yes stop_codon:yes gene_type:complete